MGISIILASHGLYAQEALNAAKMIIGDPRMHVDVVSVTEGRSMDECYKELTDTFGQIDQNEEVLILVDLYGGTPANITAMLLLNQESDERILAYAGLNLPMLLELFGTNPQTLTDAKQIIETTYSNSLVNLNDKTKGSVEDGNQTL